MPNLTCDEGGVLKEVDLFWEIDDDTFKMKIFTKKKVFKQSQNKIG